MDEFGPLIHCTPPEDPTFLTSVGQAFDDAATVLTDDGDMALLVGTLIRVRSHYPRAWIIALPNQWVAGEERPVWLVSRDGWAEISHAPTLPHREHPGRLAG
ncbi:MAG: hypothetical protein QOH61_2501 [Chloroflexota bacterium]|jgi:hypothetical protein|nr:hypothetical protein [Chloroflexota bacterium]